MVSIADIYRTSLVRQPRPPRLFSASCRTRLPRHRQHSHSRTPLKSSAPFRIPAPASRCHPLREEFKQRHSGRRRHQRLRVVPGSSPAHLSCWSISRDLRAGTRDAKVYTSALKLDLKRHKHGVVSKKACPGGRTGTGDLRNVRERNRACAEHFKCESIASRASEGVNSNSLPFEREDATYLRLSQREVM